ncbi:MAG: secretin N-terminal domain-containing protein, partial [Pirellulaceae bacterium]|nr:secretin N-terminal domain-containing protein [Pirellulaceae bacterium]
MKFTSLKFYRYVSRWAGLAFCISPLLSLPLGAQEGSGNLEAMQLEFPVQRIETVETLPAAFQQSHESGPEEYLQTAAALDTGIVKMSRRLANLKWQKFEQKLVDLWGDRIQATAEDSEGSRIRIVIPGDQSGGNQMVIDRKYNAVTFEGDPHVAENWNTLIDLLDRVEDGGNLQLVGLGEATAETMRRAIGLLGIPEADSASLTAAMSPNSVYTQGFRSEGQGNDGRLQSIPFRPKQKQTLGNGDAVAAPQGSPRSSLDNSSRFNRPPAKDSQFSATAGTEKFLRDGEAAASGIQRETSQEGLALPFRQEGVERVESSVPSVPASSRILGQANSFANSGSVGGNANSLPGQGQPQPMVLRNPLQPASATRSLAYSAPRQEEQGEGPRGMNIVELQQDPIEGPQGTVKIRVVDELNAIVLIGDHKEVKKVKEMILNSVSTAGDSQPISKLYNIRYADSTTIKATIDQIYETAYLDNNGAAEVVAISTPNSLMVVGQETAQDIIADLIKKIDIETPVTDDALDFRVFRLKHMSAVDAGTQLAGYFRPSQGETDFQEVQAGNWIASVAGLVSIIIDYRSNSLIVKGNQSVLRNAERILSELDVDTSETAHVVKVFKLFNTLAVDIASILQNAINGQLEGAPQERTNGQNQQTGGQNNAA